MVSGLHEEVSIVANRSFVELSHNLITRELDLAREGYHRKLFDTCAFRNVVGEKQLYVLVALHTCCRIFGGDDLADTIKIPITPPEPDWYYTSLSCSECGIEALNPRMIQ